MRGEDAAGKVSLVHTQGQCMPDSPFQQLGASGGESSPSGREGRGADGDDYSTAAS